MNSPSLAWIVAASLLVAACPDGSKETETESGTGSSSTTNGPTTSSASTSETTAETGTPTSGATSTTEPATTEPATTEPATTEPATTEPATTEPATTEPATTGTGTETGTTGETSGTTTGGDSELEAACGAACDMILGCDPNANKDECLQECLDGAGVDPKCVADAITFNNCIASYTCDEFLMAQRGDFGKCAREFTAFINACQ